jgi:hypothetical protein
MTAPPFDQTVDMGADGNTFLVDASQPHGFRFAAPAGGVGGAMTKIGQVICTAGQPQVAFASTVGLPWTQFTSLRVTFQGRDTQNSGALVCRVIVNGDNVTTNYSNSSQMAGSGGTPTGTSIAPTAAGAAICEIPGSNSGNNYAQGVIDIINSYTPSGFWKTFQSDCMEVVGASVFIIKYAFLYKPAGGGAPPVTNLNFNAGGVGFAANMAWTLYGIS